MKSIASKITVILICGFALQLVLAGSAFKLILTKQIVLDINQNESMRQKELNDVIKDITKIGNKRREIQKYLLKYTSDHNIDFRVKDMEGGILFVSADSDIASSGIEERAFIEFNDKPSYVLYAYFPAKVKSLRNTLINNNISYSVASLVILIASFTAYLVHSMVGRPLKKISQSLEKIDYGSTNVKIPYSGIDEIGVLCRSLEKMETRLRRSEEEQVNMIRALSHDIKTPLTSVIGYVSRIKDGKVKDSKKLDEYNDVIYRKALDIKNLVDEIEEIVTAKKEQKIEKQKIYLKEYMECIIDEVKNEVVNEGRNLKLQYEQDENCNIYADPMRLKRVFMNIIQNSLKYADNKSDIIVRTWNNDNYINFEISDGGKGIPENELQNIFDRFYRLDASRSRNKGGTGLGLSICRDIIYAHDGDIFARINNRNGLSIVFSIPKINE